MYEVFEHTADLGLRVRAGDLDNLFAEAGRGLVSLVVENPEAIRPQAKRTIEIKARSLEDLFFDWLAELLYLLDARRLALCRFEVKLDGTTLRATVAGEAIDPQRHRLLRQIKAITYHGLSVRKSGEGWIAQVIVDI